MSMPQNPSGAPDPSHIMQVGMGFMASKVLLSAVELGLFSHLAAGPQSADALRAKLELHPRSAVDFLDSLVALGLLAREGVGQGAVYSNTPSTATFLDRKSPAYIGGILEMANARLYPFWGHLTEGLRTGAPQNEIKAAAPGSDLFAALYGDPAALEGFMAAMAGVQVGNFMALAGGAFDWSKVKTLADVGGASAALSVAVAQRHPHMRCSSFDLPAVAPIARRRVEAAGVGDRVEVVSGDFMNDPLPRADVITMGNILHDWGTDTKRMLIRKAYEALPAGGTFIAIEAVIDDDRRQNAFGLLMSLNMLIETADGFDYTASQFDTWCREAGFKSTRVVPLTGPTSAAIATK
jgi:precorrin-6B methylase 2